jgi:hypothetical protein
MSSSEAKHLSLFLTIKTWIRDSHGLFDYESQSVNSKAFECRCQGSLCLQNDVAKFNVWTGKGQRELPQDPELAKVARTGFSFSLQSGAHEEMWQVVRYMSGGCILAKDLMIKLGRVRYHVKEIADGSSEQACSGSDTATSDEEREADEVAEEREESVCRVCYDGEKDHSNPLLSHCKCDGSVKYIHLECMKLWLRSKVTVQTSDVSETYHWKSLECDICKTELPLTLKYKGRKLDLFDFDKPQAPYLILEATASERHKAVHVIHLTPGRPSIKLGRGHDSDVRINDISVSRCHAVVSLKSGKFVLADNNSKFGTLVQVKEEVQLSPGAATTVQVGRSVIDVEVRGSSGKISTRDLRVLSDA